MFQIIDEDIEYMLEELNYKVDFDEALKYYRKFKKDADAAIDYIFENAGFLKII
jgi:hypothetical protein